eukprot:190601-Amphidinium_carterae.1
MVDQLHDPELSDAGVQLLIALICPPSEEEQEEDDLLVEDEEPQRRNFRLTCRSSVLIKRRLIARLEVGGLKSAQNWRFREGRVMHLGEVGWTI